MNYLCVGTDKILKELFIDIKNTNKLKPTGGLWATLHDKTYNTFNLWVDHLCCNPCLIYFNNLKLPSFKAVYIVLKESANILYIQSEQDLENIKMNYPLNDGIDFEKLAKVYDGIYITTFNNELYKIYSVNSLILFNTNCILYYMPAEINIESLNGINSRYKIFIKDEMKIVEEENPYYIEIINKITKYLKDNNIKYNKDIETSIISYLNDLKEFNLENKQQLVRKIFYSI